MLETAGEIAHGLFVAMIGPVVVTGPGAASVRERVEEERTELLGASSSEGGSSLEQAAPFLLQVAMPFERILEGTRHGFLLVYPPRSWFRPFPNSNSSMPQGTVRTLPEECIRPTGNIPPDQAVAADRGPETDPNYGNGIPAYLGEVLQSLAHVDGREASLEKSGDRREDNEVLG